MMTEKKLMLCAQFHASSPSLSQNKFNCIILIVIHLSISLVVYLNTKGPTFLFGISVIQQFWSWLLSVYCFLIQKTWTFFYFTHRKEAGRQKPSKGDTIKSRKMTENNTSSTDPINRYTTEAVPNTIVLTYVYYLDYT